MGRRGSLPFEIKPIAQEMKVCGPAVTVNSPPTDNLTIHKAIYVAEPGDVLVVVVANAYEAGYWGEIMTCAAQKRGIAGLVIDGCARDAHLIREMGFPVFSRGLSIRGTNKKGCGLINHRIAIGDVVISPGDLVVGDADGVVVVPHHEIASVLDEAQNREEKEQRIKEELSSGKTTLEIYGWDWKEN